MNKRQTAIIEWKRDSCRQIEAIYGNMVKRARPDPEALKWAKAWRLEKLLIVCRKARERMERLQCQH